MTPTHPANVAFAMLASPWLPVLMVPVEREVEPTPAPVKPQRRQPRRRSHGRATR